MMRQQEEEQPPSRRLVGIDLGIASRHSVRVLEADGRQVCRSSCVPTVASLSAVEQSALAGAPEGTRLAVVFEPTGPAWLPIAVFFARRGHAVYRVSSAKAADLRRFLRRHAKSNGIDAETLARLPLADPRGLQPLELPGVHAAALDRRVRACDRLTKDAATHKVRIKDLVRQLLPMTPLAGDLGTADLAMLERYADPRKLAAASEAELTRLIATASNQQQGQVRAREWQAAAAAALELYGDHPAVAFDELAAEVATEVRLLKAVQAELAAHAAARQKRYKKVDPRQLARSLPGFAQISAPVLVAAMGRPGRFPDGARFKSFVGLAPRASQTGETDRKGQPMSKAGPSLLRATFVRAAGHRPQAGSPARPDLLPADDRTRRYPPQGLLRRRRPPRRTRLDRDGSRQTICDLRQQRQPGHPRAGQADHRGEVDRPRGRPQTPPKPHDGGEGPSGGHNRAGQARRPSPPPIVAAPPAGRQARHLTRRLPARLHHQPCALSGAAMPACPHTSRKDHDHARTRHRPKS